MSESMQLQVLQCPACKSAISSFSPFKSTITCPRCQSVIKNPIATEKSTVLPNRYIPFSTEENDFEKTLINTLVQEDFVPTDIFSAINTESVFKAYLPMYLYEGSYNSSWSCESSYEEQQVKISDNWTDSGKTLKTKNVKKWRPQNGTASGNFAFLCLANESDELPEELREFTHNFPYDVMMSQEFNGDLLKDEDEQLITIPKNADATLVWQKHGKNLVDKTAEQAALNQIGNQEIRNFRASSSFNLTTKGEYVLAPFWFVYYTYNNEKHNFMMDGTGQRTSYSYPVNQEEITFVNDKERIKKITSWLWLSTILIWYLINFTAALIALGVWFVAKIVVNRMMNKQIQSRLEESREARRAAAAKL